MPYTHLDDMDDYYGLDKYNIDITEENAPVIILIALMKLTKDKNAKAIILNNYISQYGPVPDNWREKVREAL